ncbi:MAG: PH domain-containing protein [Bryobacterales bacterium]|nr:PH domain-containing protein [Bryobacterales bacterium]
MSTFEVRPSPKFLIVGSVLEALLLVPAVYAMVTYGEQYVWLLAIPVALGIFTAVRWIVKSSTRITVADGRLRYQSGIASKTTRTLELGRIQDVTVKQSMSDRMLGLGAITVVTASETGSITMEQIDQPQRVAEQILDTARAGRR